MIMLKRMSYGMTLALALAGAAVAAETNPDITAEPGVLWKRLQAQEGSGPSGWVLQAYRPSYILPVAYGLDWSEQPLRDADPDSDAEFQDTEIKFQFSFKIPIWEDISGSRNSLYAAY